MPATAGRVRMPANNRVHSSAALQTHGIWQSAIGYDPYAPESKSQSKYEPDNDYNAYASFQGLLALAKVTGTNGRETRGACKKCGRVGHLTYQCRNFLSFKNDDSESEKRKEEIALDLFNKITKSENVDKEESESDENSELNTDSDSSIDPEIERIIAERYGKKTSKSNAEELKSGLDEKSRRTRRRHYRRRRDSNSDSESDDSDRKRKNKRRRDSKSDSDSGLDSESRKYNRREHRRRRRRHRERRSVLSSWSESTDSSSDERKEKKRRRKHRD